MIVLLLVGLLVVPALAHGVVIDHAIDDATGEITVTATFDTGTPLAEAQVIIFAPDDLINPWDTGTTDADGMYTFLPDYENTGFWDIQVRQAGHGGLVNVEITPEMAPQDAAEAEDTSSEMSAAPTGPDTLEGPTQIVISGDAQFSVEGDIIINGSGDIRSEAPTAAPLGDGFTPGQIAIMSISVVWGFVGTALYFMRRKTG